MRKIVCSSLGVAILFSVYAHSIFAAEPTTPPHHTTQPLPPDSAIFSSLKENAEQSDEIVDPICNENKESTEQSDEIVDPTRNENLEKKNFNSIIIEFRASYFRPFSKTSRKLIHGGGGVDYGLATTIPVWKGLNIWGGVDYFAKGGTMIGINRSVHITMVPITLGLKYIYYFNRFYGLYAGAAGKYYFVEVINRVHPMYKTTHRNGLGSVVEVGNVICIQSFVIDVFSSWSFKTIDGPHQLPPNATSSHINVGGWNIGMGVGYKF